MSDDDFRTEVGAVLRDVEWACAGGELGEDLMTRVRQLMQELGVSPK